jgi:hypothetical protein
MKHYYGARAGHEEARPIWRGIVYHWTSDGEERVFDFYGLPRDDEAAAIDDAADWMDENGIEAELE